ncbi:uncharacterized protein ARMOST_08228 [Armillaria ostoyae]|uniref:Uncharacterized protein n=1 Tax=Armillaria ostoyae TaxID=47428 RepID=A0A284R809_ARMOS|nr:uncharacterized protein ARMOST_08228 [Armillaria ostoyae]
MAVNIVSVVLTIYGPWLPSHDPKNTRDSDFNNLLDNEQDDNDSVDDDKTDPDERAYLDRVFDELELEMEVDMDESKPFVMAAEAKLGRFAIFKMTELGKKAFNNTILCHAIAEACEGRNIKEAILIHTVVTCWNTVSDMLQWGIDLREILDHVCDMMKFNKPPKSMR